MTFRWRLHGTPRAAASNLADLAPIPMQRARLTPLILILVVATVILLATRPDLDSTSVEPDVGEASVPEARLQPRATPDPLAATPANAGRVELAPTALERTLNAAGSEPIRPALRGRVIDAVSGQPMRALRLQIVQPPVMKTSLTTDENGAFRFPPLRQGTITFVWPNDGRPLRAGELAPTQFVFGEPGNAPGDELVFRLTRSEATVVDLGLEFHVLRPDGSPAADARVVLGQYPRDGSGGWSPMASASTSELGRVRFPLDATGSEHAAIAEATQGPHLIGRTEALTPPFAPGPWALQLELGGSLHARIVDGLGRPLQSAFVSVKPVAPTERTSPGARHPWTDLWRGEYTNTNGKAFFGPLPAATYEVAVRIEIAGVSKRFPAETTTIRAGASVEWTRTLEIERATGVAGQVVDEQGRGLPEVTVGIYGTGGRMQVLTDESGHFECVAFAENTLVILPDPFGDLYEPAYAEVSFGSMGVRFRRVATLDERTVTLLVRDRASGEPVKEFRTNLYLDTPRAHYGTWTGSEGTSHFQARLPPGTRVLILAQGYLPFDASVDSLLAGSGADEPVRLELERGFRLPVRTLDYLTDEPVPGVRFSAPGAPLAITDQHGMVSLEAPAPPETYNVECPGYESREFAAAREYLDEDFFLFPDDEWIYVMPLKAGAAED